MSRYRLVFALAAWVPAACGSDATDPAPVGTTITTAGGTVTSADGRVTLVFPPGAVSASIAVVITPTSLPSDPRLIPGSAYHFEPSGAQFSKPVELTIRHGALSAALADQKAFVWVHKWVDGTWIPVAGSGPDTAAALVRGELTSFSNYGAVMSEIAADLTALQLALIGLLNDPVAERVLAFIDGFQSLLAKQATPLFHALAQPIINAMFSTACIAYKNAVDVASNTVIDDYRKLGNLLSPVASWEAMVEEIRAGACLPPLSLGDLYTIKLEQFTNFYIARLNQPDFTTDFPSLLDEVDFIQEVRGDAVLLGADLLDTRLENEAEVPLFNHLRASAYAACRAASKHDFLGQLRLELAEGGGASFTEDDVLQDLQYCATRLGWQLTESDGTQKGQGTLGGGSSPGSVSRTASAQGVRGGSLVLSQDVRAFRCADGAFAADQLILTVGGVELQRLNPGANGNFFAAPVTIHGQQLLSAAGIDPDATGTHRLEIARSTSTCASNYVQSTEGAVTLATIDLQYPADEEALDIDGVWALHVDGMCHGLINFKQQGASFTVSGGLDGINCPYSTSGSGSGTLSGLAISAGIAFNGIGQVNFTGAVSADGKSMGGTYTRQGGSGSWTAVR